MKNAHLGTSCIIGEHVIFEIPVFFGDRVKVGSGTVFSNSEARAIKRLDVSSRTVIEHDVIIGANCTIVGNTVIKRGAIIGDGSVVLGTVFAETFVAGNPARKIYSLSAIKYVR